MRIVSRRRSLWLKKTEAVCSVRSALACAHRWRYHRPSMAHPTSIVRGRVLSTPITAPAANVAGFKHAILATLAGDVGGSHALVTLASDGNDAAMILTVSNEIERSVDEWRALLIPATRAHGVEVAWAHALVMHADVSTHRDDE